MADLSSEMIVDVEQYQAFAQTVKTESAQWESVMKDYLDQLNFTKEFGMESGSAADAFLTFVDMISELKGKLEQFGKDVEQEITSFLSDVDTADRNLFTNKGNKVFTDEEFKAAFAVVDNTPKLRLETLDQWLESLLDKYIKSTWKAAGWNVKLGDYKAEMVKRVKKAKMKSSAELNEVKNGVRLADRMAQQKLGIKQNELNQICAQLQAIESVLSIQSRGISHSDLVTLRSSFSEAGNVKVIETDADVETFAQNVENYFAPSTCVIIECCENSLGKLIVSDFDNYRATVEAARDFFNQYSDDYTTSKADFDAHKQTFDEMLGLYQKYGAEWREHADSIQKDDIELFNKIVSKTAAISKASDDYIDIWFSMFCDMSASKEAFARFKANCDLSKVGVQKALERVEDLYDKKVDAYISETIETIYKKVKDEVIKKGAQAVVDAYADYCESIGGTLSGEVAQAVGAAIISKAFAEAPAVAKLDWIHATQNSFDNAVLKLKNADPASYEYQQLIEDVRTQFAAAKQARADFFTEMEKSASSEEKKQFYHDNLENVQSMSLMDIEACPAYSFGGENHYAPEYIFDGQVTME